MASGVLSFPFRLSPTGEIATVERGSDREVEEAIAVLLLTRRGERPMVPEYGTPDPAYAGLSAGGIQLGLDEYGPDDIVIEDVDLAPTNNTTAEATVRWSRANVGMDL